MELSVSLQQQFPITLNVKMACNNGEVMALVGPSGSGKSSILRCIAGLYKPKHGKVFCSGNTWFDSDQNINIATQQRRVGMVFQNFALFPHLSVIENVMIPLQHLSLSERKQRAYEILQRVNLKGLESRLPHTLSGGQQQRVALARALVPDPEILLLDEPFSAVDHVTRRKLRLEAMQLTRNLNIPVILVTHDMDEAYMLANQISVLHKGKTLQNGAPDEVMCKPVNATVARLIDMRNVFEGTVIAHDPENNCTQISWLGGTLEAPYTSEFRIDEKLDWCISNSEILLHRRIQPSRGIKENAVSGVIKELISTGSTTNIIISLIDKPEVKLYMELSHHVARRNSLKIGETISVSLLKNALHLMHKQTDKIA